MNPIDPRIQLMHFILGKWISKPITVVAELGIADLLSAGPISIDQLALETDTHAPSLYRVMRALASVGIFFETEDRLFTLSPLAEGLKTGALRSTARMMHADWNDRAWLHFNDSIHSGHTAFESAFGKPLTDWLEENPEAREVLSAANAAKAARSHRAIVDGYDFSGIRTLLDVGGGTGTLLAEILDTHPQMRGVLVDLPGVTSAAEQYFRQRGLTQRCTAVAGDFFQSLPAQGDALLLSHVLHDWPDDRCGLILDNCAKVMRSGSKLLILEMLIPPGNEASVAKLLDLEMFVITGGKERTEREYTILLNQSHFRIVRIIPLNEISLIEAVYTPTSDSV